MFFFCSQGKNKPAALSPLIIKVLVLLLNFFLFFIFFVRVLILYIYIIFFDTMLSTFIFKSIYIIIFFVLNIGLLFLVFLTNVSYLKEKTNVINLSYLDFYCIHIDLQIIYKSLQKSYIHIFQIL